MFCVCVKGSHKMKQVFVVTLTVVTNSLLDRIDQPVTVISVSSSQLRVDSLKFVYCQRAFSRLYASGEISLVI